LNILIIGLGSIAQKHIVAIREVIREPEIYALRSEKDKEPFPGVHNIYSLDELATRPDFVIISNPTHLHSTSIRDTVTLGCPLFIEKPVIHSLEDLENLRELLLRHHTTTYVACNMRFHPAIQFLRSYLNTHHDRINEVNVYCGSYLPDWRRGRNFRTIYSANKSMGGGVHLDLVHEMDYCCWLFGMPSKTISLKRNVSCLQIDAVDFAHYNLLYDLFVANITLNYYRRDDRRTIEIVTEEDTIEADLSRCTVTALRTGKSLFGQDFKMKDTYAQQMKYFLEHIEKKQKPMNDFFEAVEIMKIVLT